MSESKANPVLEASQEEIDAFAQQIELSFERINITHTTTDPPVNDSSHRMYKYCYAQYLKEESMFNPLVSYPVYPIDHFNVHDRRIQYPIPRDQQHFRRTFVAVLATGQRNVVLECLPADKTSVTLRFSLSSIWFKPCRATHYEFLYGAINAMSLSITSIQKEMLKDGHLIVNVTFHKPTGVTYIKLPWPLMEMQVCVFMSRISQVDRIMFPPTMARPILEIVRQYDQNEEILGSFSDLDDEQTYNGRCYP
jgi:hypothetical protein